MRNLIGAIIKANEIFGLIKKNDRILIGVSGGKDSTLLYKALKLHIDLLNKNNMNISLYACHVNINFYKKNYDEYLCWMNKNNLPFEIIDSNVGDVLKLKAKNEKVICSFCAKMKKALLVEKAKKIGYNKIALAHHVDDAIETFFLNLIFAGNISTFSPNNYLDRNKVSLIRPFILLEEKFIIAEAKKQKIPLITGACPNEHTTKRGYLKNFLEKNFYANKEFINCYKNFKNSLLNGKHSNLWFNKENNKNLDLLKTINTGKSKKKK